MTRKKKAITLREMVVEARAKGHFVQVKERTDGSLRVVAFDGKRFRQNSSAGNQELRSALGHTLSKRRRKQLRAISTRVPPSVKRKVKIINEFLRRAKGDKADGAVPISQKQVNRIYRERGYRSTMKMLREYERSVRPTFDQGTLELWLDEVVTAIDQMLNALDWSENTSVVLAARRLMAAVRRAKSTGIRKGAGGDIRILRYNFTDIIERMVREAATKKKSKYVDHRNDRANLIDSMNALTEGLLNSLYRK